MGKEHMINHDDLITFNASIQKTTGAYLQQFPEEVGRLSILSSLLKNPAVDLRQRSTIPEGHICASGIIVSSDRQKVLMLLHKSLGIWVVPGGHYDITDKTPENTALREANEETGFSGLSLDSWHKTNGIPLDIDTHAIPANPKKGEGAHVHYDFRYMLGLTSEQEINLDPNESLGFQWVSLDKVDPKSSIAPAIAKLPFINALNSGK